MKSLLASAISLALAFPALAAAPAAPEFDGARLSSLVRTLSADDFEGRGPATAGEKKTVDFIVEHFKEAGLSPGGDLRDGQRQWTQAVPLRRAQIDGTPELSLSIKGTPRALAQGEDVAIRAALDGSSAVAIADAPLVFLGYGVKAPERQWDDFKGQDLRGKIGIVLINDPDFETGHGDFGGPAMTYYGRWTYKYEEAARQGLLGLLIVHETAPASYGWPTVKNSNTNAMFDVVRENAKATHSAMPGWIQRELTVDLFKQAGLDFEAQKKLAQTRDFQPVELKGITLSARYAVQSEVITSYNVVGRIEGKTRPDEHVVYSGHWDHLGVGLPDADGDTIYNGAVDNATGIAAMIEIGKAQVSAGAPERSMLFMAVTAEEKGLLGTEYYASNPLYPLATTVAMINMDALDPGGAARDFTTSGSAKQELLDQLIATAQRWDISYSPDPHPEAGYFFRSDHFPIAKRGVPAVSFGSGENLIDGGVAAGKAAGEAYNTQRYHQPADEWEASWTFAGMQRDLQVLYTLGRELADSKTWPNWDPASEFRAARDASAAERK